jgi:predicted dehydrogenase
MIAAEERTGTLVMEAQHTHYHPICIRARELIADGAIGRVRHISGTFTADVPYAPDEIRWNGAVGGGALWDLGVYPAYWLRSFMSEEPVVEAARHQLADSGADIQSWAALRFPAGATGEITADMANPATAAWVKVEGARGEMLVMNPLSNSHPRSITVTTAAGSVKEMVGGRISFALQLEAFRDAVLSGGTVPTRGADSLATIRLLAAIRAKAEES